MISLAIKVVSFLGVPEKAKAVAAYALIAVLAGCALWAVLAWDHSRMSAAYDRGVTAERTAWQAKIEADKKAQAQREAKANATLIQQRQRDQVAADQRTKEISDATRNIPDQGISARQRARVCIELRRQGKAPPDCGNLGSGGPAKPR